MQARLLGFASLVSVLIVGCGGTTTLPSDASTDRADGPDDRTIPPDDRTIPPDDRTIPPDDGPRPVCFVDFPCFPGQRFGCTGATTYRAVETHDCSFRCTQPCSGGTCDPTGPELNCPSGTRCVNTRPPMFDTRPAPCEIGTPDEDGGADASADAVTDSGSEGGADATTCPLPPSVAECAADDECATIARGCYCGAQPVDGVNRRFIEAAAVCEMRGGAACALGCAVFPGRRAQDGQTLLDGGVIAVRCARDGGVGRCMTYARP